MMGGALVTTAGAMPIGAGTIKPRREPGGAGMNTPVGPMGGGPGMTPGPGMPISICMLKEGATKATPGAPQKPLTKITAPLRCS